MYMSLSLGTKPKPAEEADEDKAPPEIPEPAPAQQDPRLQVQALLNNQDNGYEIMVGLSHCLCVFVPFDC